MFLIIRKETAALAKLTKPMMAVPTLGESPPLVTSERISFEKIMIEFMPVSSWNMMSIIFIQLALVKRLSVQRASFIVVVDVDF